MAIPYTFSGQTGIIPLSELDSNFSSFASTTDATQGSSLVGYLPAGSGAVGTTVQAKLRESVSVLDFGATGNGSTDDTAAIQAALDSGALSIYAPSGTYRVTATINITRPVTFYGDGLANTIFSQATNFDVFYIYNGVGVMSGVNMFNFGITNTQASASVTSGAGIKLYKVYYSQFSNITITNTYIGIDSTQSNVTKYNGVNVTNFNYVGYWFHGGSCFDSYVANCAISGGSAGFASVYLQDQCDEMTFYSVIMNTSQYNLYTDATAYGVNLRPEFCRFFACSFDSSTTGVFLRRCTDMTFTGCFFSNRPGNGLQIGTTAITENVVFLGCTFFNNGGSGAVIGEFAANTVFDDCNFIGNSTTTLNTGNGLSVAANAIDFTITNCNFRNGWGSVGSQNYGLAIAAGTSDRFVIANNNFGTNGTGGNVLMGATGTNRHVTNNIGFVTKNSGNATILNGTTSIVVTHGLGSQPLSQDIIITPRLLPTVAVYISALSATTFTISAAGAVGADTPLNWVATILKA